MPTSRLRAPEEVLRTSPSDTSANVADSGASMRTRTRAVPRQVQTPKGIRCAFIGPPQAPLMSQRLSRAGIPVIPRDDAGTLVPKLG